MKKVIVVAAMASWLAMSAQANLYIDFYASEGFFLGAADPGSGFLGVDTGNQALLQLWYASDGVIDQLSGSADTGEANFGVSGGNDTFLTSWVFDEASGGPGDGDYDSYAYLPFNEALTFDDGGANTVTASGLVYGRIFQDEAPSVGDWYFVSDGVLASDLDPSADPAPTATALNLNPSALPGDGNSLDQTAGHSFQVVPEPGTLALFGLGILTLISRRRKTS